MAVRMICLVALAGSGLGASGCTVMLAALQSSQTREYKVEVISDPPGARIEVDEDYVGDAPLTITMLGNTRRQVVRGYEIRALPIYYGHSVQRKWFPPPGMYTTPATIPKRIFFDMSLARRPDRLDVDVNIENERGID
jgi:hypothetical protein